MVAPLVPKDNIPELTKLVDSPAKYQVLLRFKQQRGVIINGSEMDEQTADILRQFTEGGLADAAFEGQSGGKPSSWALTGNGERLLKHLEIAWPRLMAEKQEKDDEERARRIEWLKQPAPLASNP